MFEDVFVDEDQVYEDKDDQEDYFYFILRCYRGAFQIGNSAVYCG